MQPHKIWLRPSSKHAVAPLHIRSCSGKFAMTSNRSASSFNRGSAKLPF
jgi:hypothetical protein